MKKTIATRIMNLLENEIYKYGLTEKQIRKKLKMKQPVYKTLTRMHQQEFPIVRYKKGGKGAWIYWYPEHMHHMNYYDMNEMNKEKIQVSIWK